MFKINENYLKLPGSYLFSTIGKKVAAYSEAHPDKKLIRLGIGDVTQPLAPAIIKALHKAVDEMGAAETFHGYAPDLGYEFLRSAIAKNDYQDRGCDIAADEIFVSDGAKCDCGNIQEIFGQDNRIAVCDPVYPVYVDTNVMAGRAGDWIPEKEMFSGVIYMPCTMDNDFVPEFPKETPDMIYLCYPNNPTGSTLTKAQLQEWVDYANKVGAVILFDAAYEAYISEEDVPHSIYECEGARTCAIEFRSFSKNAGFTGVRLGFTVVPKDLKCGDVSLHSLWATEGRRGGVHSGRKSGTEGAGSLLHEERRRHLQRTERGGLYGGRRRQRSLHLAENTGGNGFLEVLRLSPGDLQRGGNTRVRLRPQRRGLFSADRIRYLRKYGRGHGADQKAVRYKRTENARFPAGSPAGKTPRF